MVSDGTSTPTASRPGGRSARVRVAVHRAAEELLAEGGPDAATIPAVAERAGVHPTTVYRRWGTAAELLTAVAVGRLTGGLIVPDTGSLADDLRRWARDVVADLSDPETLVLVRTVLSAAGEPAGRGACLDDRRSQLRSMLEQAAGRGEPAPPLEHLVDRLLAPIYFRALFESTPIAPERADVLVTEALAAPAS